MKLATQKIFAREFLLLVLILCIGVFSFLATYPYNSYRRNIIKTRSTEILEKGKIADSLSSSFKVKIDRQAWFFNKFSNYYDLRTDTSLNTKQKVWKRLFNLALKDSIKYKWEKIWDKDIITFNKEIGLSSPEIFKDFIIKSRINSSDSLNNSHALKIKQEIKLLHENKSENNNKILSYKEQIKFGVNMLAISFTLLFGIRYLFYSIRWSIKILKQAT